MGIGRQHFNRFVAEWIVKLVGYLKWRVWDIVGEITEEGLTAFDICRHKIHGAVCTLIGQISRSAREFAIVLEFGVEILPPVSGTEPKKLVKSPCVRVIGMLRSIVPLAISARGVSSGFEHIGYGGLVEV